MIILEKQGFFKCIMHFFRLKFANAFAHYRKLESGTLRVESGDVVSAYADKI